MNPSSPADIAVAILKGQPPRPGQLLTDLVTLQRWTWFEAKQLWMRSGAPGVTHEHVTSLGPGEVFVFGSNTSGVHGRGAAKQALRWGAQPGIGEGLSGATYALPTREFVGGRLVSLPLESISKAVDRFIRYAEKTPQLMYLVTEVGCGLAGYDPLEIASLFYRGRVPVNVKLPASFWREIQAGY